MAGAAAQRAADKDAKDAKEAGKKE